MNRPHVAVARAGEEMKPRLTLLSAWYDCGWRYETWQCTDGLHSAIEGSPKTAYYSWKRMAGR